MALDFHPSLEYIKKEGRAPGGLSVTVDVNERRLGLTGIDARIKKLIESRFKGFLREGEQDEVFQCALVERDYFLRKPARGPELYRMESRKSRDLYLFWSYGFAAFWDPLKGGGRLVLTRQDEELLGLSVENFYRLMCSLMAVRNGGFLFHAAGIVKEDKAYVFFGPSGSGKSTAAGFSKGAGILSDDMIILRKTRKGFSASGTPFKGTPTTGNINATFPVAGMFRLVKAGEVSVEKLHRALGMSEVICSIPLLEENPDKERILSLVEEMVRQVPVARLHFRKDGSFWKAVEEFSL